MPGHEEDGDGDGHRKFRRWAFPSHDATVFVFWSPFLVNGNFQLDAMTAAALRKEAAGLQLAHFASPCSPMRSAPPRLCQRRATSPASVSPAFGRAPPAGQLRSRCTVTSQFLAGGAAL